jgi:sorbin and SH3 domain-containing protein 1
VLSRRNRTSSESVGLKSQAQVPPWNSSDYHSDTGSVSSIGDRKLTTSYSTPATGFSEFSGTARLPKAQNPTITLLQKAREGQFPKGALYIDQEQRQFQFRPKSDRPPVTGPGEILYQIKNEYTSESENERSRKMTDLGPRKFEGIGPVSKDGMPLVLRSEVKDQNQSKWYKRMYDTIHKQKPHNDEYVTIRYKQKRAQYPYTSGYLSEPEPGAYDSDFTDYRYQTLDRRRPTPQVRSTDYVSSTMPRPSVNRSVSSDIVVNTPSDYKNQPGRIENYTPGRSSISDKEAKQWWDEVMDIFDGHLEQQSRIQSHPKSFINQALKESGYESDSTLVFKRREEAMQQLNPKQQKEAYKVIQKGGDVPLQGLRKLAPERPKDLYHPILL